ncbi:hypothetical protein B0H12DRAFT_414977 [Mycena haematopus]|nr:hypothetical protein B0H12DRAFT_414977 [Mycena haematopus]
MNYTALALLAVAIVVLRFAHNFLSAWQRRQLPFPPGPSPHPLVGDFHDLPTKLPWLTYRDWGVQYGSDILHASALGQHIVVVNSVKAAVELFEKRSHIHSDRPVITMVELMASARLQITRDLLLACSRALDLKSHKVYRGQSTARSRFQYPKKEILAARVGFPDIARDRASAQSLMSCTRAHARVRARASKMYKSRWGWDFSLALLPLGDRWRRERRMFQQHFRRDISRNYRPIQMKNIHQLLLRLLASPQEFREHIKTLAAAIIMATVYGYEVQPSNDRFVSLSENAVKKISESFFPGAVAVNAFPMLRYLVDARGGLQTICRC